MKPLAVRLCVLILLVMTPGLSSGEDQSAVQEPKQKTGVVEHTGQFLPLDTIFVDSSGRKLTLGEIVNKPTLFLPVYFNCPRICSFDMANLALALQQTSIDPDSFAVITMSFDHQETSADAARAKQNYTTMLKDVFPTDNWYFLTGEIDDIMSVTGAIGYTFRPAEDGLFLHPSALAAIAEDGKIIKYVYGSFLVGDVDLALSEAAKGTPSISIKRFIAYCMSGEIQQSRTVLTVLKSVAILLIGIGGFFLFRLLRGERN